MKGQMAMSLLDGLKRKKTKHIREELLDAPTLFGGVGNDSPNAEKKISVLSAAGGKPARRARQRRAPVKSGLMIRPIYVVLLIGTIVLAGVWQTGVLDRNVAVTLAAKFDTLLRAGLSVFDPSGEPASAHAIRAQSSMASLPASRESGRQDEAHSGQAALIERVALVNSADSPASNQPGPAPGSIEAALNTPASPIETTQRPAPAGAAVQQAPATTRAARPIPKTPDTSAMNSTAMNSTRSSPATHASTQPGKASVAPEKTAERKVQMTKSKEPDADAKLVEALLVHLRKMESANGGSR